MKLVIHVSLLHTVSDEHSPTPRDLLCYFQANIRTCLLNISCVCCLILNWIYYLL